MTWHGLSTICSPSALQCATATAPMASSTARAVLPSTRPGAAAPRCRRSTRPVVARAAPASDSDNSPTSEHPSPKLTRRAAFLSTAGAALGGSLVGLAGPAAGPAVALFNKAGAGDSQLELQMSSEAFTAVVVSLNHS